MLTLTMLRHAKSSWGDSSLLDKDRPLNSRGKTQARSMGTYLSQEMLNPDLIICSSAKRARKTLKQVLKNWKTDAEIIYEDRLYLASTDTILALLAERGEIYNHIMIIGHNPGFHMLANALASQGEAVDLLTLSQRYPTTTLCVINSQADSWKEFDAGTGELKIFATPKSLATN